MAKKAIENQASQESLKGAGRSAASGSESTAARWEQLFVLAEHWKSDLDFFYDELKFFHNLIDQHFLSLIEKDNIERTRQAVTDLAGLEKNRVSLGEKVASHMRHLKNLVETTKVHDTDACLNEHMQLEKAIADFTRQFRKVKTEIFEVSGKALESEKQHHLVGQGKSPGGGPK